MIPILYEEETTNFSGNGIGRLSDCISCKVTEKESGIYECKFQYPMTGIHYDDIRERRIIYCTHDDTKTNQPLEIYARTAPHNGVVTFFAHHVTYKLGNVILNPFTATSCSEALLGLKQNEINTSPFTYWTDKSAIGNFEIKVPTVVRSILAGVQGSILDVFGGGDYEWDHYTVKLYNDRGQDNNVNIRYGVNMLSMTQDIDDSTTFNAVAPFWYHEAIDEEDTDILVTIPEKIIRASSAISQNLRPITLDLSSNFDSPPTIQQLRDYSVAYMNQNTSWKTDESVTVDFIALWQTDDYKDVALLQRVRLYDYVHIVHDELGVDKKMQVVSTEYNVLTERYDRMELGASKQSFAEVVSGVVEANIVQEVPTRSYVNQAIAMTAATIRGNRGGYKLEITDADGHTMETLYMDAPNVEDAVHILRIGMSGIAFSDHGYDPEYFVSAWDINGNFNANFIASGIMNANLIKAGIISDLAGRNYWNLETGEFSLQVVSGDPIDQAIQNAVASSEGYTLETPFTWSNNRSTANFTAIIYRGKTNVTAQFPSSWFVWTLRTEDGETQLGTGTTLSVNKSLFGFGATVTCTFTTYETAALRSVSGARLNSMAGEQMLMYAAQDTDIIISDLPVKTSSTIALTDKLLGLDNVEGFQITISNLLTGIFDPRYVNVTGDTMTGALTIKSSNLAHGTVPSSETYGTRLYFTGNDDGVFGQLRAVSYPSGFDGMQLLSYRSINGSYVYNVLTMGVNSDGTRFVSVTESAPWRSAIGAVNIAGDTMTGDLTINKSVPQVYVVSTNINSAVGQTIPDTGEASFGGMQFRDNQGYNTGWFRQYKNSNDRTYTQMLVRRYVGSSDIVNGLTLGINADGTRAVSVSESAPWRAALSAVYKGGDTMSGGLTISLSTATDVAFRVKNSLGDVYLDVGTTGNHGVWSGTHSKWLLRADTSGNVYLNGMDFTSASTARTAIGLPTHIEDRGSGTATVYSGSGVINNSSAVQKRSGTAVATIIFQVPAGTYDSTKYLLTLNPAPTILTRFSLLFGSTNTQFRLDTSGRLFVNNTITVSGTVYVLGQVVYAY